MKIGIFDSGIGGLSVAFAISRLSNQAEIHYACDHKHLPYGTKSDEELAACVFQALETWPKRAECQALVIACNTASTALLDQIRFRYDIPIFGVVPPLKPASERSVSKVIALLATPATIHRPYIDRLISQFAPDCTVLRVGSRRLVELAEDKMMGKEIDTSEVAAECQPILSHPHCDQIALGCTHFSFLQSELQLMMGERLQIIDPADAVARHLCKKMMIPQSASSSNLILQSLSSTALPVRLREHLQLSSAMQVLSFNEF